MAKISRHELKSDEFVSGVDAAFEYFLQHRDQLIILIVAIAVLAGLGYGGYAWNRSRNQHANALLSAGLDTLHAPLMSSGTPPGVAAFASVQTRAAAAEKQFDAAATQYPSTSAGQLGLYYKALAQLDLGDPGAEKTLQSAAASHDPLASLMAKHALANFEIQRDPAAAQGLLLQLSQQNSPILPRAVVLMELANLDRSSNPAQAAQYYRQLQADYPNTATAQQAAQALAAIK